MSAINNAGDLLTLLNKALEIERGFESVGEWEGYVSVVDKEFRSVLLQLASDSGRHARMLESLVGMVHSDIRDTSPHLQPRSFNFRGRNELEVMTEVSRTESLMLNTYSDIRDALRDSGFPEGSVGEDDLPRFMKTIEELVADESRHFALTSKYVRKLDRLR